MFVFTKSVVFNRGLQYRRGLSKSSDSFGEGEFDENQFEIDEIQKAIDKEIRMAIENQIRMALENQIEIDEIQKAIDKEIRMAIEKDIRMALENQIEMEFNQFVLDNSDDSDFDTDDTSDPLGTNGSFFTKRESSNDLSDYSHLWIPCEKCSKLNYTRLLKLKMHICEYCGYHLKMTSLDRLELLIDSGTWNPMDEYMVSLDPIEFHSEEDPYRLDSYQQKTELLEAVQTGIGQLHGIPVAIGIMDLGGNTGFIVGEKIIRLIQYATDEFLPLIIVCASGGARMQEGSLSFIQIAKISSALYHYQMNPKLFYVSILTSPTTVGVTASLGMLGDIAIVEPDATIAFAGKRVIEQMLNIEVPEGSQSAEFLFKKGFFNSMIMVPRNFLKDVLRHLFQFHGFLPLTQNEK